MTIILPARWHSSRDIAIKIQKKDAVSSAAFLDEAQLLKQLQHPNIIKLLGVSSETTPIYLLLEYMVNGRLSNYLREGKGHELGLSQLLWIAAQVLRGEGWGLCVFFFWIGWGDFHLLASWYIGVSVSFTHRWYICITVFSLHDLKIEQKYYY